jgi:hypothetical protein
MIPADRSRQDTLLNRIVAASAEPDCVWHHAKRSQDDGTASEDQRNRPRPRWAKKDRFKGLRGQQYEHYPADEMAHRLRSRRYAAVVGGDRVEDGLGKLGALLAQDLNVEHQIYPEHGEEEGAAGAEDEIGGVHPAASVRVRGAFANADRWKARERARSSGYEPEAALAPEGPGPILELPLSVMKTQ